jgi:hypothetical protein
MNAIPLIGSNIYLASALTGVSVQELDKKIDEARDKRQKDENRKWAIAFLGKDEQWYDEAMKKIETIQSSLPKDIDHKEQTIRLYGWIADSVSKNLTIPMETDHTYARAYCVELVLTNPDLYTKVINWD